MFKNIAKLLKGRVWRLIKVEILFTAMFVFLAVPVCGLLSTLAMKMAGFKHVGDDNAAAYLMNPLVIIAIILQMLIIAYMTLANIMAILTCLYSSKTEKIKTFDIMLDGFKETKTVLKKGKVFFVIYLLLLVPLANLATISDGAIGLHVPEFIVDAIKNNVLIVGLIGILLLVILYFLIRWAFAIHYMFAEEISFKEARKKSREYTKGKKIRVLLEVILTPIIYGIIMTVAFAIIMAVVFLLIKFFVPTNVQFTFALNTTYIGMLIFILITFLLAMPVFYSVISAEFNRNYEVKEVSVTSYKKAPKVIILVVMLVFIAGSVAAFASDIVSMDDVMLGVNIPDIHAHRGSSINNPENSMAAFKQAIKDEADYIELDVHQTKDQKIVVTHDSSLSRITSGKVNKEVYELTYDEIHKLDVGSWFDKKFSYLRVATLDEVMDLCKGKIKLNIEIKPTGHEKDFEKHVIEIVRRHNFENDCMLASLNYDSVKKVKELAPDIKTLALFISAVGDFSVYKEADAFSVEETFLDDDFVPSVHQKGKEVLLWTINRKENCREALDKGVDGIITDNPLMVQEVIAEEPEGQVIIDIISEIFPDKVSDAGDGYNTKSP